MMLVSAFSAGAGVGNFGRFGSAGWARAGSAATNRPASNVSLIFILLPPCLPDFVLAILSRIIAPQPFQRHRQGLHHHPVVDMARPHGEDIAIVIALFLEDV